MEAIMELRSGVRVIVRDFDRGLSGQRKEVPTSFEDSEYLKFELSATLKVDVSGMLPIPWVMFLCVDVDPSWILNLKLSWYLNFSCP